MHATIAVLRHLFINDITQRQPSMCKVSSLNYHQRIVQQQWMLPITMTFAQQSPLRANTFVRIKTKTTIKLLTNALITRFYT